MAAGLLRRTDRFLLCHRRADRAYFPNVWDFPGGHVEADETPATALRRELAEELGIEVEIGPESLLHSFGVASEILHLFDVTRWSGEPFNKAGLEHDEIRWFGLEEATEIRLAHEGYLAVLERALG